MHLPPGGMNKNVKSEMALLDVTEQARPHVCVGELQEMSVHQSVYCMVRVMLECCKGSGALWRTTKRAK